MYTITYICACMLSKNKCMILSINVNQYFSKSFCITENTIDWYNRISLSYKRLWLLVVTLIIISFHGSSTELIESNNTSNKILFSIEEINEEEFLQAERTSAKYNLQSQKVDSIAQKDVLEKVFLDAQKRIAKFDSTKRAELFDLIVSLVYFGLPDSVAEGSASKIKPEDELYNIDNLLYYPELNLLGFCLPTDFFGNCIMWWYDSTTGLKIDDTKLWPSAMNTNGIFVCQVAQDCDFVLDLHFFQRRGDYISEIQTYKNLGCNSECIHLVPEEGQPEYIFWHENNQLYLRSWDYIFDGSVNSPHKNVYFKITLHPRLMYIITGS